MEKVSKEKAKKQSIIKWVAIAACLVIVVGVIIIVPGLVNPKTEPGSAVDDQAVEENVDNSGATADNVATNNSTAENKESHLDSEKCDPIIPGAEKVATEIASYDREKIGLRAYAILTRLKFTLHEGHEMNWYEFYNGCIEGTVGQDTVSIRAFARDALDVFTEYNMTTEAAQAQAIIDALNGGTN